MSLEPEKPAKTRPSTKTAWDIIKDRSKWNDETISKLTPQERRLLGSILTKIARKNVEAQTNLLPIVLKYGIE